jgi:hypothetical protein
LVLLAAIDHGRFNADLTWTGVKHKINTAFEISRCVGCRRRADPA